MMTTVHEVPDDVCSDEEPIFELGDEHWIGTKVSRAELPESETAETLGKFLILKSFVDFVNLHM